jgi:hypothetical protein
MNITNTPTLAGLPCFSRKASLSFKLCFSLALVSLASFAGLACAGDKENAVSLAISYYRNTEGANKADHWGNLPRVYYTVDKVGKGTCYIVNIQSPSNREMTYTIRNGRLTSFLFFPKDCVSNEQAKRKYELRLLKQHVHVNRKTKLNHK